MIDIVTYVKLFTILAAISETCGVIVPVNSGIRTPEHNKRVGGVPDSKHLTGEALDLGLHGMSSTERSCVITQSRLQYKKVLVYPNHLNVE